ncbi:conserved exported hypothetical protein [groundwater metagenome]|uniref:DUF4253 domain-containing protein n=1 Tax=groundwater metagenome TaxID=717931 RepID=A0A098E6J4_9ZZZZ
MKQFSIPCLIICILLIIVLFSLCLEKQVSLSLQDKELAERIGFDEQVLLIVKKDSKVQLQQLTGFNENGTKTKVNGLSINAPYEKSEQLVFKLRPKLRPKGYMVFLSEVNFGIDNKPDEIAILKGTDQYDILRIKWTNGINYGIENKDVIDKLKEWEKRYPFEILGADFDWIEAEFKTVPEDMDSFVEEVYEFCPDIVNQGINTFENLSKEMRETKRLYLWWD